MDGPRGSTQAPAQAPPPASRRALQESAELPGGQLPARGLTSRSATRAGALCAAALLIPQLLAAQSIRGRVLEEGTESPIASVDVLIRDTAGTAVAGTQSDGAGHFYIELEEFGSFVVLFRHLGYADIPPQPVSVRPGEEVSLQVRLSADTVALDPFTVVARRFPDDPRLRQFYDRAEHFGATGRGRIIMRDDIDAIRPVHTSNILNSLPVRSRCATIYVDGLPVDDARFIDSVVGPDEIEGIEVYHDRVHIPLQFQRRNTECAILIWRRPYGEGGRPFNLWRFVGAGLGFAALILLLR
jgi:hypothetical protein